jgi:hypothetical protein
MAAMQLLVQVQAQVQVQSRSTKLADASDS